MKVFGVDRVMFGSDWPVLKLRHKDYQYAFQLVTDLVSNLSHADKEKVFKENAIKFYNLKI